MAEDVKAGDVVDGRTAAKGLLPKYLLVWMLIGFGAVLTVTSVISNVRGPRGGRAILTEKAPTENPKKLDDYGMQLEADEARNRALAKASPPPAVVAVTPPVRRGGGGGHTSGSTENAAREATRAAAGTFVISRRPMAEEFASGRVSGREPAPSAPPDVTTDEIVASILKAKGSLGSGTSVPSAALLQAAPVQAPSDPPAKEQKPGGTPPISGSGPLHRVLEGTTLDATLWLPLEGSTEASVKAVISGPVFSHNREFVLIPDGTFALGKARAVQNYNESRLAVAFHRLEFPDGSTVSLDQYAGLDEDGTGGLHDTVNNHYLTTFGRAAAVGVLQGLGQWVGYRGFGGQGNNSPIIIAGNAGQSSSSAFNTLLNRMPLPTVEIRAGHRLKIYLTSDIELRAWSRVGEQRPVR